MKNLSILSIIIVTLTITGCQSSGGDDSAPATVSPGNSGANTAPAISGNPPSAVKVGETFSFTPSASDSDGDALTFSIQNKPSWASFDTATGNISGIPTQADIGIYAGIQISVSDGQATSSMPGFTVEVTQIANGSATLSWTAPTQNEDGSTLTDLAGYKIYYGKSSGVYTNTIRVEGTGMTTYVVQDLSPDTYYFSATAFNTSGIESQFSNEAVKTIGSM